MIFLLHVSLKSVTFFYANLVKYRRYNTDIEKAPCRLHVLNNIFRKSSLPNKVHKGTFLEFLIGDGSLADFCCIDLTLQGLRSQRIIA